MQDDSEKQSNGSRVGGAEPVMRAEPSRQDEQARGISSFLKDRPWLFLIVFGGLFALVAILVDWQPPVVAVDQEQPWLNTALPAPGEDSQIHFTFAPRKDGLSEIEMQFARYGAEGQDGLLDFRLLDDRGAVVASETWSPADKDNQVYTLRFAPQRNSSQRKYSLTIDGSAGNSFAPWGYDADVRQDGALSVTGEETTAQELQFKTRYQLSLPLALSELTRLSISNGGLIILAFLFMILPGLLLLLVAWSHSRSWDPLVWVGLALALGVSLWPLIWLWSSTVGIGFSSWSLWVVFLLGWLAVILLLLRRAGWRLKSGGITRVKAVRISQPFRIEHLIVVGLLLFGLALRMLAVRDLAFPAWVDSSRHALITEVMASDGRIITDYEPLLSVTRFPYHFGFHTLSASISIMAGVELQQLLLILGQLINALVPLSVYAGLQLVTKRRRAATVASFLVVLPFLFPGYYATWGRFTQLVAMAILPLAIAFTWLIIRGARTWRRSWWMLAVLASGMFLTHFRVFLLYLPFAAIVWLFSRGRNGRWLAISAGLSILLCGPRIIRLLDDRQAAGLGGSIPGYNEFPTGYIDTGWERSFLILVAAFIFICLVAVLRSRRWAWLPLFLAAWSGLVALLLSGWLPFTSAITLVNLNSAYISFFLPLSWILAVVIDRVWMWLDRRSVPIRAAGWALAGVLLAAMTLYGINRQVDILNPQTILAKEADLSALHWLDENLPHEAKLAVNSWQWLGNTWTGSDGGAWILPLTGRESATPPADYIYESELSDEVAAFNSYASTVEDWSEPAQSTWLKEQGITHIYTGERGGFFDPSDLSRNPHLSPVYQDQGVFIFSVN